jgi:hypothetical protein
MAQPRLSKPCLIPIYSKRDEKIETSVANFCRRLCDKEVILVEFFKFAIVALRTSEMCLSLDKSEDKMKISIFFVPNMEM